MTAILRLIPLNIEECRTLMENMGKPTADDTTNILARPMIWMQECNRQRKPIRLKLCSITDDIIDVDNDDDVASDIVKYASTYQDGRFASVVSLGRNPSTGITWGAVSRAVCDVSLTTNDTTNSCSQQQSVNSCVRNGSRSVSASLTMRKAPGTHGVHLDGELVNSPLGSEIELKHGSIISLLLRTGFAYQVHILENGNDTVTTAPAAALMKRQKVNPPPPTADEDGPVSNEAQPTATTTTTARQLIRERAMKTMESDFTCAMCFDVLVKSTFAFPCSHAFCEECSLSVTNCAVSCAMEGATKSKGKCPTCRGNVDAWMPARSFDALVWSFALQGFLDSSDAEYYLERRAKAGEDVPTEEERGSIMNITNEAN